MVKNNIFFNIKKRLKGKIVIIGVGNYLRGDDGAGPEFILNLKARIKRYENSTPPPNSLKLGDQLVLMNVQEVPENYLGKIIEHKPDTIVLVDAVDLGSPPGTIKIVEQNALLDEGFTTHNASLRLTIQYLKEISKANIFLLGIQPENINMNVRLSQPVIKAIKEIEEWVIKCMKIS
jgi:hydrogenase 3 maturation protease